MHLKFISINTFYWMSIIYKILTLKLVNINVTNMFSSVSLFKTNLPFCAKHTHKDVLSNRFPISKIPPLAFFFFFFLIFLGPHQWHMEVPRQGPNQSCSCRPMPQPQQHGIQATSATYTTAHGNAGSLTHWARPGIEPATSWFPVGFISAAPRRELPKIPPLKQKGINSNDAIFSMH